MTAPKKVTELERSVLLAAWHSQYHDGRFPVGDGQWAEVEHLGKSAQGAVASCVKKGWLQVQGSGKKGDEVVHTITAEGAAAIGMPATREEWEQSKVTIDPVAVAALNAVTEAAEAPKAEPAITIDGFTKRDFITYLRDTLIPDLRESGRDATADDFETAIKFIEGAP